MTQPNGESPEDRAVGSTAVVDEAARRRLFSIEHEIREHMGKLGQLREKYLEQEKALLKDIEACRSRYASETMKTAESMGLQVGKGTGQRWDFSPDEMTFTRVR